MTVVPLAELPARLPKGARLLGLDLGEKTIGLAISDRGLTVASPLETLRRTKFSRVAAIFCRSAGSERLACIWPMLQVFQPMQILARHSARPSHVSCCFRTVRRHRTKPSIPSLKCRTCKAK